MPNEERVYFQEGQEIEAIERAENQHSHLTAWFKLNQNDAEANQLLYVEIPNKYTFDKKNKVWKKRVHVNSGNKVISRMYSANPKEGERFYSRVLSLHVKGTTSLDILRLSTIRNYLPFEKLALQEDFLKEMMNRTKN